MRVIVRYLGGSRVQAGCAEESLELPVGATVAHVERDVGARHPALARLLGSVRWARNYELVGTDVAIGDGDEIAILPPVSGGAPHAVVCTEPIDPGLVQARVAAPDVGAIVLFIGTVRDHARGEPVAALHYEAYEPMATRQLERICARAEHEHDGTRLSVTHRHGTLHIGDVSVVIAAAHAHRDAAFAACRWALEQIKVDVPIWKREQTAAGEVFVGWGGG